MRRRLDPFVTGLNGRPLKIEPIESSDPHTATETLFLPVEINRFASHPDNTALYRAMAVHLWSQTWFGTWRYGLAAACSALPDYERAVRIVHLLETLCLDAGIARELPGMHRPLAALVGERRVLLGPWSDAAG